MSDDLADIIASLRAKRAELLTAVDTMDGAIAALESLTGAFSTAQQAVTGGDRSEVQGGDAPSAAPQRSVLQLAVALAEEAPRSWSADEIIDEYTKRGTPLDVKDPQNAVFSAVARATKKGMLVRVGKGRYAAPQHAARLDSVADGAADASSSRA